MDESHPQRDDLGSADPPRPSPSSLAVRIVAGAMSVVAGGVWLMFVIKVLRSRFATDILVDPHGYIRVFGTVLAIPAGLVCALVVPFAFPPRARARAFAIAIPAFITTSVLLIVALIIPT